MRFSTLAVLTTTALCVLSPVALADPKPMLANLWSKLKFGGSRSPENSEPTPLVDESLGKKGVSLRIRIDALHHKAFTGMLGAMSSLLTAEKNIWLMPITPKKDLKRRSKTIAQAFLAAKEQYVEAIDRNDVSDLLRVTLVNGLRVAYGSLFLLIKLTRVLSTIITNTRLLLGWPINKLGQLVTNTGEVIFGAVEKIYNTVKGALTAIVGALLNIPEGIIKAGKVVLDAAGKVVTFMYDTTRDGLNKLLNMIRTTFREWWPIHSIKKRNLVAEKPIDASYLTVESAERAALLLSVAHLHVKQELGTIISGRTDL